MAFEAKLKRDLIISKGHEMGLMAFHTCTRHPNHINHPLQILRQLSIALIASALNSRASFIFETSIEPLLVSPRYAKQLSVDVIDEAAFFCASGL